MFDQAIQSCGESTKVSSWCAKEEEGLVNLMAWHLGSNPEVDCSHMVENHWRHLGGTLLETSKEWIGLMLRYLEII